MFLLSLGFSNISQGLHFLEYQEWCKMLMILDSKDFAEGKSLQKVFINFDTQSTKKKNKEMQPVESYGHISKLIVLVSLKIVKLIGSTF